VNQLLSRNRRVGVSIAAALAIVGTSAAVRPAARFVPGLSFKISSSTKVFGGETPRGQDDEVMRGRGIAAGNRSRIEFLAFTPAPQGVTTDDFLIATDSGHAYVLHTNNQRFTTANDMFGGPAVVALGRVMGGGRGGFPCGGDGAGGGGGRGGPPGGGAGRAGGRGPGGGGGGAARGGRGRGPGGMGSGFLDQLEILEMNFKIEKLGAGEVIDTRPTQHYKITTDYRVVWGGQGFPAHAVTELWTVALPIQIPNPFEPLIVADQSTDGPLIEYALKLRAIRAQLEGTPIRVVTTTTFTGVREIAGFQGYIGTDPMMDKVTVVQQTQLTAIQPADVDLKLLTVPDSIGY
jgi:hypothetical protein